MSVVWSHWVVVGHDRGRLCHPCAIGRRRDRGPLTRGRPDWMPPGRAFVCALRVDHVVIGRRQLRMCRSAVSTQCWTSTGRPLASNVVRSMSNTMTPHEFVSSHHGFSWSTGEHYPQLSANGKKPLCCKGFRCGGLAPHTTRSAGGHYPQDHVLRGVPTSLANSGQKHTHVPSPKTTTRSNTRHAGDQTHPPRHAPVVSRSKPDNRPTTGVD